MAYITISNWNATDWSDSLEAIARGKFIPMIMSAGAKSVHFVRTGDRAFSVVTEYADEKTADAAKARIGEIRTQAAEELKMTVAGVSAGTVFATA
jgi:hypothetical protein